MKVNLLIAFVISLIFSSYSFAQKNCLNTLREAKELYEQGLINEIPQLLSGCMESGFTRAQRIEAYKMIILAYLFDDDQFAAEKMMDEFLKKFPEYEVMPNDPVEFVYLLESYQTSSFYSINVSFGPTFSNPRILEQYTQMDREHTIYSDKTGTGYQFLFGISRNLWKDINGSIGVVYSINKFTQRESSTVILQDIPGTQREPTEASFAGLEASEAITKIDLPLTFTYRFGKGNINYFIRAGGMVSFVTKDELSLVRSQENIDRLSTMVSVEDNRRKYYCSLVGGAGIEYKIPRGFLVLDVRYCQGMQNIVDTENRYSSSRYFHTDDDFMLNSVSVSLGYHFRIYQSKKNRF